MKRKKIKSVWKEYLTLSMRERRGLSILLGILLFQIIFLFYLNNVDLKYPYPDLETVKKLQKEIEMEALTLKVIEKPLPEISTLHSFDPNKLNAEQWMKFGLSEKQSNSVLNYLKKGGKFRVKKEKSKRNYLSKEQLDALVSLEVPQSGKAQVCKDMFMFSVYGGGLRFGDVIELQWKHFRNEDNRITKVIRKTGRQHSFKLGSVAIEILDKYKTDSSNPEDFIFPLLEYSDQYFKDNFFRSRETERHNALCNFHLNNFGKTLELPFSLSFHLSRHTFATRALNNGMRIEHVSKLMDHSGIGITQVYAKIINEELDKAVDEYIG